MAPVGHYKVQEAASGRAKCQACKEKIVKGELRLGVLIEHPEYSDWWKWRHWDCITHRVVQNIEDPSNLEGLASLPREYQDIVHKTFGSPPAPKPRKQKAKKAKKASDSDSDAEAAAAAYAAALRSPTTRRKGKGTRGGGALGDTADAEVPLSQQEPDPLEYLRADLGRMMEVQSGGELPELLRPFFEGPGPYPGQLSVLISQLQEQLVLSTPWPTPEHDALMPAEHKAATAAAVGPGAAAAGGGPAAAGAQEEPAAALKKQKKGAAKKKKRAHRSRGEDSDGNWD